MGRSPCCEKVGLKKGPWTPEEDQKLIAYIEQHGHGSWRALPTKAGLQRCGKSCRLRWSNYLRPDIKRGKFSLQEERTIIQLHALLGNRWSAIAAHLAKRTDNEIKNYWNTHLKKRLTRMGIDPTTHKPKTDALGSPSSQSKDVANLSHMAQWESARLEAEARLVKESKFQLGSSSAPQPSRLILNKIPAQPSLPPCLDVLKAWRQSSWSSSSPAPPPSNHNNKMHNMYALMLAAAATDLESPTSTLSFPETTAGLTNENLLPPPTAAAEDSATCGGGGVVNESWGYLTKQKNPEILDEKFLMSSMEEDHDDIMVAVEAFIAERYNKSVPAFSNSTVMEEGGLNDDVLVYDSNENNIGEDHNLGILGVDDGSNVYFEEKNHYWNGIAELGEN